MSGSVHPIHKLHTHLDRRRVRSRLSELAIRFSEADLTKLGLSIKDLMEMPVYEAEELLRAGREIAKGLSDVENREVDRFEQQLGKSKKS